MAKKPEGQKPLDIGALAALLMECLRCGHSWLKRIATRPKRCPQCLSRYWDKPRKRPKVKAQA